jgi:hypothetical protein
LAEAGRQVLAERRRQWAVVDSVLNQVWRLPSVRLTASGAAAEGL